MLEHEKWLLIAKEDWQVAKLAFSSEYFSSAIYHCQQCAEKSLKGFLSFKSESITKTHDLIKLLELCMQFDPTFQGLYSEARELNPFSTKFRYPTEFDIPAAPRTEAALKQAKKIMNFVSKKIFKTPTGQMEIV
jgi:HEPN domain-containing protein